MYSLKNDQLIVSILDPVADVEKLGSRYCTGGYIWQIADLDKGNLLAGPHYPSPKPRVFDGQGAPEMFRDPLGAEGTAVGDTVMCIGVGLLRRTSEREPLDVRHNPVVTQFVTWKVLEQDDTIVMMTSHTAKLWSYGLTRKVTLNHRSVISVTEIENTGDEPLPIRWFPHPFYPLTEDNVLCKFSIPITMDDNPGYWLGEDKFIRRNPEYNWEHGGWFQALEYTPEGTGLTIIQKHDGLGEVKAVTDYDPSFLPIWGNHNTFSFEPYLERKIDPGETTSWQIAYSF